MNILFNSKIILKNNIGGKSKVCRNHCAFIKSQHINFSISNEKHNIKKNELAKNTNTGFIELYHKLLETKQIEKDPFQYKFILVLQFHITMCVQLICVQLMCEQLMCEQLMCEQLMCEQLMYERLICEC
ncbi:hypothetical protein [Plasmodium yoelii yoelii]|uniref:Uncharacterized protein n=1 Tax=Plasmodium yoelii yoelii TaxID=73239 RepID=Q7RPT8_PLAYO|nr:hypothetical protein [Plasmodium yoelii yoelii]